MTKGRMEAFSDGVIAIIITIMVLELPVPHQASVQALRPLVPKLLSYVLSFVYMGIYWNNHHHLLQAIRNVNGAVLWANLHLLFWLSLAPLVTAWMGETHFASVPVVAYGVVQFLAAIAYTILVRTLLKSHERDSALAQAVGRDVKGKISVGLYLVAVLIAIVQPRVSCGIYALVALMWLVPDRRIERTLAR
ncbi:MAG TPA: TMEM175 family protein [Candidatus Sulfotelmatobacter sp.]|nr:TMEM175 family protein [Candidatus Sulfotelmatobacter sp.]